MQKSVGFILSSVLSLFLLACSSNVVSETEGVANEMGKSQKRGVAFNFALMDDLPLLTPYITWDYNWGAEQNDIAAQWFAANDIEFCPMAWGRTFSQEKIRQYVSVNPSCRYLLAFNEPNLNDQAKMTPTEAAAQWGKITDLARELNLKIVAPAMNYGTLSGYGDPIRWLDEFFAQDRVSIDDVDAIAIHCYMSSPTAVGNYIQMFAKYGKPIWMTEFCAWDPVPASVEVQMQYMCEVLNMMEQNPLVERYAWFIPRAKAGAPYMQLLTPSQPYQLTELGQMYCHFSTFDKTTWLRSQNAILAKDYVACSNDVQVRYSNKETHLILNAFQEKMWTQYQIYNSQPTTKLTLRYATLSSGRVLLYVDDALQHIVDLPMTGRDMHTWKELPVELNIDKGKHTLKLEMYEGVVNMISIKLD